MRTSAVHVNSKHAQLGLHALPGSTRLNRAVAVILSACTLLEASYRPPNNIGDF